MIEPTRDNIYELLTSLCDRELDAANTERLERYVSSHPELVQWLADQRKLTEVAARVVTETSSPAPEALRDRILRMAAGVVGPQALLLHAPRQTFGDNRLVIGILQSLAALLLLALGMFSGRYLLRPKATSPAPPPVTIASSVVPPNVVALVSFVHADCARFPDAQHAQAFPKGDLSEAVRHDLESEQPIPDLSPIGFRYIGAGPCGRPLQGAVHLLYRPNNPKSRAAISIFVQRFDGQFQMDVGKLYSLATPQSPFPVLAWRSQTVAYFLVADDESVEGKALEHIRSAPKP